MVDLAIDSVSVVGAGNMGHGIAETIALAGYPVTLHDVDEDVLSAGYENIETNLAQLAEADRIDKAPEDITGRIETDETQATAVADADLVVEAVPERMELKQSVFADLDENAPAEAILATNTSSLSVTKIASGTDRPGQVVGMHFFNPPVKMDLVEVISGDATSDGTVEVVGEFVRAIGKTPVFVQKDIHGFVVNNVLAPFIVESDYLVSDGDASIRDVDAAMVHRRGYPMGPFELSDMSGLDVTYEAQTAGDKPVPPLMEQKYESGQYGRKTGVGYYDYEDGNGVDYAVEDGVDVDTLRVEAAMINSAASLIESDIATADDIDTGMKLGAGFPAGICRRADMIGLDVVYTKLQHLYESEGADRHEPAILLQEMVASGRTGQTVGEGFFTYDEA